MNSRTCCVRAHAGFCLVAFVCVCSGSFCVCVERGGGEVAQGRRDARCGLCWAI